MADTQQSVFVAGATGRLGRLVVAELLSRGYHAIALLVRPFDPPEPPGLAADNITLAEGDLASADSLEKAMAGADFMISAIGSKKPFSKKENDRVDNRGNANLVQAARRAGIRHAVVVSSIGAGNSREAVSCIYRLAMGPVLRAKTRSEDAIRSCGIAYTIIRPGGYTQKDLPDDVAFGEGGKITGLVKREQIARVCVDALSTAAMRNRTLEVVNAAALRDGRDEFVIKI